MAKLSKAERKALNAAKANAKAKTENKETKTVETPKVEPTKVEEPKKVEPAKVEKPKAEPVKKETPTVEEIVEKKPEKAIKPKKEKIPTIIPEPTDIDLNGKKNALDRANNLIKGAAGIPLSSTTDSLNGKAMLAYVMFEKYGKNDTLSKHYPELYNDLMRSVDVVTLLALVDIRQELIDRNEKGELNLVVDADQILPLQSMADMLGIKLAAAKALPASDGKQLQIDFTKSEVPKELTPDKRPTTVPELDPNKITDDTMLKEALYYLITKSSNTAENIVNTVEWFRVYCGLKENNADKKLALDEKSVADWINDIFKLIQPSVLLNGLGKAVYMYTSQTGSPCMAHSILHTHMHKLNWTEEQIAETLKALINENFKNKQKDDASLKPQDDKALKAMTGVFGQEYIEKLFKDYNIDLTGLTGDEQTKAAADRTVARMVIGALRNNYYEKEKKAATIDDLRMLVGRIINLYRDPADRLAEYCEQEVTVPIDTSTTKEEPAKAEDKKK